MATRSRKRSRLASAGPSAPVVPPIDPETGRPDPERRPPSPAWRSLGEYVATAYGPPWGGINGPGIATACGTQLKGAKPSANAVAAPPDIECGTVLHIQNGINGTGDYVVWDRGGAIQGKRLDFYHPSRAKQLAWGRKSVRVFDTHRRVDVSGDLETVLKNIKDAGTTQVGPDVLGAIGDVVNSIPDAIAAVAEVLEGIGRFFVGLGELLLTPEGWARLAKLVFGAVLLWVGLNRLLEATLGISPGRITRRAYVGAARRVGRGGAVYGGLR